MSLSVNALSRVMLSMPNEDIIFDCTFSNQEAGYSRIEIDYFGTLSNFPNFRSLDLPSHVIAYMNEIQNPNQESGRLEVLLEIRKNTQIICSSTEDDFASLLVIIQAGNSYFPTPHSNFAYVLLKLDLATLCANSINSYLSHIENVRASILHLQDKGSEMQSAIEIAQRKFKKCLEDGNKIHGKNSAISSQLHHIKSEIFSMHSEYRELEDESCQKYSLIRCILCMNNIRSVLYRPCGHVLICNECLTLTLKSYSKGTKRNRNKGLSCQQCKIKVTDTKTVYL